eukprot:746532-Hanusia_phi.AAC.2
MISGEDESQLEEELEKDEELRKYWKLRYTLFSLYDHGVKVLLFFSALLLLGLTTCPAGQGELVLGHA